MYGGIGLVEALLFHLLQSFGRRCSLFGFCVELFLEHLLFRGQCLRTACVFRVLGGYELQLAADFAQGGVDTLTCAAVLFLTLERKFGFNGVLSVGHYNIPPIA